jgi:hypothetical protein
MTTYLSSVVMLLEKMTSCRSDYLDSFRKLQWFSSFRRCTVGYSQFVKELVYYQWKEFGDDPGEKASLKIHKGVGMLNVGERKMGIVLEEWVGRRIEKRKSKKKKN